MFHILHKKTETPRAHYLPQKGETWFDTYFAQVKASFIRAWNWKVLWIWGLLLPVGSGININGVGNWGSESQYADGDIVTFFSQHMLWVIVGAIFLVSIFFIFWILANVAKWGLVQTLSEIQDAGRPAKNTLSLVWQRGRSGVWRLMILDIMVMVFWLVVVVFFVVALFAMGYVFASQPDRNTFFLMLFVALFGMMILLPVLIFGAVIIRYLIAIGIVIMALTDQRIIPALKHAWRLMRGNMREVLKLMLTRIVMGLLLGVVLFVIMMSLIFGGVILAGFFAMIVHILHVADSLSVIILASIVGVLFAGAFLIVMLIYNAIASLMTMDLWVWWVKRLIPALRTEGDL